LPNHNLELLVSSYDNKVYFSVIEYDASLNQPGPLGPQHNFIMHTRQEIPNLKPTDLAEYPDGKAFILANTPSCSEKLQELMGLMVMRPKFPVTSGSWVQIPLHRFIRI